ncbi:restriction endonuclease subunit S [Aestuariispira ectoiniformans]|uniref:restriction endonuclease subunit S n=1 Tax=Aestuariispira ectoiniformans TaxID=2775080 RepID=UPI00223BC056|nr:restriction endonuclease subunit S [Aestuariispira ectoiniformans]
MIRAHLLSSSWPRATLSDVVDFLDNLRRPVKSTERVEGPYPYYGANGQQGTINNYIFDEPLILLAEDGGHFGVPERRIAYSISGKSWVNNHAHVLRPKEGVDLQFLQRHLEHYDVTRYITGSTRAKLTKADASRIEVVLPPFEEQRRIAAILDKADAIRRKRQQALTLADELVQSHFLSSVGPNAKGYDDWARVELETLAEPVRGAMRTGPFGSDLKHSEFVGSGIAVLGIDNAVKNRFEWAERRYITPEKYEKLKRYTVKPGDVIVTIMGTTGRSSVVPDDVPLAITTKHLATITVDRSKAEPEFISNAIHRHPYLLQQILKQNKGAIMAGLNLGIIKGLQVPLPPLDVQRDFVNSLDKIRLLEKKNRMELHKAEELFASLSQRAFRGEL